MHTPPGRLREPSQIGALAIVALAATLFAAPDLLLLDEPTNYLDLEGTLWLEDHLANYPRTVIVISHDRDLLDTSVDQILHLDRSRLTLYSGGYT